MPKVIDGNVLNLIEAEVDFAQAVEFRCARKILQAALLDVECFEMRENLAQISRQVMNHQVPHGDKHDALVGPIAVISVGLVKMVANHFRDVRCMICVGEVHDAALVAGAMRKVEVARQLNREARLNHQKRHQAPQNEAHYGESEAAARVHTNQKSKLNCREKSRRSLRAAR